MVMMMIYDDDGDHHHDSPPPSSSVLDCSWCCSQVAPRNNHHRYIHISYSYSYFDLTLHSHLQNIHNCNATHHALAFCSWRPENILSSALIHLGVNMNTPHTPISFTQTPTTAITCSHSSPGGSGTRRTNTSCLGRASWPSWPPSSPPSPPDCSPPSSGGQEEVCASCPRSYRPIVCYNAPPLSSFTSSTSSADFESW